MGFNISGALGGLGEGLGDMAKLKIRQESEEAAALRAQNMARFKSGLLEERTIAAEGRAFDRTGSGKFSTDDPTKELTRGEAKGKVGLLTGVQATEKTALSTEETVSKVALQSMNRSLADLSGIPVEQLPPDIQQKSKELLAQANIEKVTSKDKGISQTAIFDSVGKNLDGYKELYATDPDTYDAEAQSQGITVNQLFLGKAMEDTQGQVAITKQFIPKSASPKQFAKALKTTNDVRNELLSGGPQQLRANEASLIKQAKGRPKMIKVIKENANIIADRRTRPLSDLELPPQAGNVVMSSPVDAAGPGPEAQKRVLGMLDKATGNFFTSRKGQ